MSIYPDDIATRDFVIAPEGFDRDEVRSFLEVLARDQQALRDELDVLREERAGQGGVGAEVADVLETAQRAAAEATRLANEQAAAILGRAEEEADRLRREATEAADRAREEADLYAFETRANADKLAREKLADVNERIERLVGGAGKVRDRLFGIDAILASVRSEVALAAESLDAEDLARVETAAPAPPPPPPPAPEVVDLREVNEAHT